jgi:hypothetical protein
LDEWRRLRVRYLDSLEPTNGRRRPCA